MDSKYTITSFFTTNKRYFPNDSIGIILKNLENLNEQNLSILISSCRFHSPTASILLSIFLGYLGADRFKLSDTAKGLSKLLPFLLTLFCIFDIYFNFLNLSTYIFYISLAVSLEEWIRDVFFIINATKKKNMEILAHNIEDYFEKNIFKNYFEKHNWDYYQTNYNEKNIPEHAKNKITILEKELNAAKQNLSNLETKLRDTQKQETDFETKLRDKEKKITELETKLKESQCNSDKIIEIAKKMKTNGIENKWIAEITGLSIHEIENIVETSQTKNTSDYSAIEIAKKMKNDGISNEEIAQITGLSIEEIKNLKN